MAASRSAASTPVLVVLGGASPQMLLPLLPGRLRTSKPEKIFDSNLVLLDFETGVETARRLQHREGLGRRMRHRRRLPAHLVPEDVTEGWLRRLFVVQASAPVPAAKADRCRLLRVSIFGGAHPPSNFKSNKMQSQRSPQTKGAFKVS